MPARYFLNAATVLVSYTEIDSIDPPAGETAVAKSVIDAAYAGDVLIGGTWDGTTYIPPAGQVTLEQRQRRFIWDAYIWWRQNGRTQHWAGLRSREAAAGEITGPLDACDNWAFHILAICDQAINGVFPVSGAYSAGDLAAFLAHADMIYRTLGPTWYKAQIDTDPDNLNQTTQEAKKYKNTSRLTDGSPLYTDIVTILGVPRTIDGRWLPMGVNIRAGFDPEDPDLGN